METISIIVPVYNADLYLEECIESLLNQDYPQKEIILVDDESKDRSGEICDFYAKEYSCIQVLHLKNGGPNRACFEGLKCSRGKYIYFCDSDDWVDKNMLSEMAKHLDQHNYKKEIVCCNYVIEKSDGNKKYCHHGAEAAAYTKDDLKLKIQEHIVGYENRRVSMSRCMKLYSRELLVENTDYWDFNLRMGDDMTVVLPAILDAERIVIMKDAFFYHYRFINTSLVHKYDEKLYENIQLLKEKITEILQKKRPEKNYNTEIEREYFYLLMLVLKNEVRGNKNYYKNIKEICKMEKSGEILQKIDLETKETANKLCKLVMKFPNGMTVFCLYLAAKLYQMKK